MKCMVAIGLLLMVCLSSADAQILRKKNREARRSLKALYADLKTLNDIDTENFRLFIDKTNKFDPGVTRFSYIYQRVSYKLTKLQIQYPGTTDKFDKWNRKIVALLKGDVSPAGIKR